MKNKILILLTIIVIFASMSSAAADDNRTYDETVATGDDASNSLPINGVGYVSEGNSGSYSINKANNNSSFLTTIETSDLVKIYSDTTPFSARFSYNNGTSIANKDMIFNINGINYTRTTNELGTASLNINLGAGNYKILTVNTITKENKTNNITILPNIISNDLVKYYRNSSQFIVNLIDSNGHSIPNKNITFNINGIFYNRTTDFAGNARLNINLEPGKYIITSEYGNSRVSNTIEVLPVLYAHDLTKAFEVADSFKVLLVNGEGDPLTDTFVRFNINGIFYNRSTDANGIANLNINLNPGDYIITTSYLGANIADSVKVLESVKVNENLKNDEIQNIIDNNPGKAIVFSGTNYEDIELEISSEILLTTNSSTTLKAKLNSNLFNIKSDNVLVKNLNLIGNNISAIVINDVKNTIIENNIISNSLNESKINDYESASILLPGNGIEIFGEKTIIASNEIRNFYNGVYLENATNTKILKNNITKNNFGVEFDYGVADTLIYDNDINSQIGLITFDMVEGPYGYGISVRHSGVNVTINNNRINDNYMGIFLDSKNSTGIVITGNEITNSIIEGFTANENYTPAVGATLIVENNALYANAKGPSLMILGEVSANPAGIYGPGEFDDNLKLRLGANWYGTTIYSKWSENHTGPGTICPRIKTTLITCNLTSLGSGSYEVKFYNNTTLATKLPDFKYYFTLNYYTDNEVEVIANVHHGKTVITFPTDKYYESGNIIEGSAGSLRDPDRPFPITYTYNVQDGEDQPKIAINTKYVK